MRLIIFFFLIWSITAFSQEKFVKDLEKGKELTIHVYSEYWAWSSDQKCKIRKIDDEYLIYIDHPDCIVKYILNASETVKFLSYLYGKDDKKAMYNKYDLIRIKSGLLKRKRIKTDVDVFINYLDSNSVIRKEVI